LDSELATGLPLAAVALGSFTAALSGALVPGPMFSATLVGSHRRGFWFGPGIVVGHALAETAVVVLLLLGLAALLGNSWVLIVIGLAGAVAMAWMGIGLVRQARQSTKGAAGAMTEEAGSAALIRYGAVPAGIITSVLNPYWYLWWVVQAPVLLVPAAALGWMGVGAFAVGHFAADLAWYSLTSLGVSRGRRFLEGRAYQVLLGVCAVILFVMAGLFVALAVSRWYGPPVE
jgi:threonine/homoserine/homoserine lactone efflux protein